MVRHSVSLVKRSLLMMIFLIVADPTNCLAARWELVFKLVAAGTKLTTDPFMYHMVCIIIVFLSLRFSHFILFCMTLF